MKKVLLLLSVLLAFSVGSNVWLVYHSYVPSLATLGYSYIEGHSTEYPFSVETFDTVNRELIEEIDNREFGSFTSRDLNVAVIPESSGYIVRFTSICNSGFLTDDTVRMRIGAWIDRRMKAIRQEEKTAEQVGASDGDKPPN